MTGSRWLRWGTASVSLLWFRCFRRTCAYELLEFRAPSLVLLIPGAPKHFGIFLNGRQQFPIDRGPGCIAL